MSKGKRTDAHTETLLLASFAVASASAAANISSGHPWSESTLHHEQQQQCLLHIFFIFPLLAVLNTKHCVHETHLETANREILEDHHNADADEDDDDAQLARRKLVIELAG